MAVNVQRSEPDVRPITSVTINTRGGAGGHEVTIARYEQVKDWVVLKYNGDTGIEGRVTELHDVRSFANALIEMCDSLDKERGERDGG